VTFKREKKLRKRGKEKSRAGGKKNAQRQGWKPGMAFAESI
jgi:hypothetical protein